MDSLAPPSRWSETLNKHDAESKSIFGVLVNVIVSEMPRRNEQLPLRALSKWPHAVTFAGLPLCQDSGYLRGVEPVEQYHDEKHERRVENVKVSFVME